MKSCFWWVLCSYCKHLNSFGLGFAGCWWCRWRLIWVPKLWLIFYPFVFYMKGKIAVGGRWEWVADLLQHALQSRSHSSWIVHSFHQSFNTSYRGVCSGGERTAEFVVVFHLQVFSTECEFAFNPIVDHCTNVAVLFFFSCWQGNSCHNVLHFDFRWLPQFYTKAYGLLHIAIFIAYMSFFIFLDCIFYLIEQFLQCHQYSCTLIVEVQLQ
jgi:hypothetical protein